LTAAEVGAAVERAIADQVSARPFPMAPARTALEQAEGEPMELRTLVEQLQARVVLHNVLFRHARRRASAQSRLRDMRRSPNCRPAARSRIDLRPLIHNYCAATSIQVATHDYAPRASGRRPGLVPRLRYEGSVWSFAYALGGTYSVCCPADA